MARSKITSASKDLIKDNGAVLISLVNGEQIHLEVILNWLTNLTGYTVISKVVEANNLGDGKFPTEVKVGGQTTTLQVLDEVPTDNEFKLVFPQTLISSWTVKPSPDKPVYGFIDLEIQDPGVGSAQQVWKPIRGLVEILYSPTEV